jgi:hypothetical protein
VCDQVLAAVADAGADAVEQDPCSASC